MKKITILAIILASLALFTGCFGSENPTRNHVTPDPIGIDIDPSAPENFPDL